MLTLAALKQYYGHFSNENSLHGIARYLEEWHQWTQGFEPGQALDVVCHKRHVYTCQRAIICT